jgi:phosphoribosylformimino-5-aminoimidazole carboxamide ribotide isomerase
MIIFPAIDIKDGNIVRLTYGDYQQMEVYDLAPTQALAGFEAAGAEAVHIVDLDGAKDGISANFQVIAPLLSQTRLLSQIGGGIRNLTSIKRYLQAGAGRVILGTAAIEDEDFLRQALKVYGERIAVGVDARDSRVAVAGWLQTTDIDSFDFCRYLADLGIRTVIYTDIACDGAMSGCNMSAYQRLSGIRGLDIIASGGISSLLEIRQLKELGVYGAIVGKALYNGALDLSEVLAAAEGE